MDDYGYKPARANGGYAFHLLPFGAGYTTALCGKKDPRHNRHPLSSHANRARWVYPASVAHLKDSAMCEKCRAKALAVIAEEKAERAANPETSGSTKSEAQ